MLRQVLRTLEGAERGADAEYTPAQSSPPSNSNAAAFHPQARHISYIIRHALLLFKLLIVMFFIITVIMYFFHLLFSDNPARRDHLLNVATQLASAVALEQGENSENKTETTPVL